jgi:hypothetical protein
MVSLESKACYQLRINESEKLTAFNNLLSGIPFVSSDNFFSNETDEIFFGIVKALQENNKSLFEEHYTKKKKSNPTKESPAPFVNDDFLIFCLVVGILRYGDDKSWIKNIISLRNRSAITVTFENLVNENYSSKSNLPEIVLMFFQLNNPALIKNDFLTTAWKSISKNTALFESRNEFEIVCTLRAYDLIVELKEAPDGSEVDLLRRFNQKFLIRIKVLSWLILSSILIAVFYGGVELVSNYPSVKSFFDYIGSVLKVLGIIGLSQVGNFFPIVRRKSFEITLMLFGYPYGLIEKTRSK